jgi:hypothetical protein
MQIRIPTNLNANKFNDDNESDDDDDDDDDFEDQGYRIGDIKTF